jgi:hypothetical protein
MSHATVPLNMKMNVLRVLQAWLIIYKAASDRQKHVSMYVCDMHGYCTALFASTNVHCTTVTECEAENFRF